MAEPTTDSIRRRWWFFALKDRLPLHADGWSVAVHQPQCLADDGSLACLNGVGNCYAHIVRFLAFETVDESLSLGISDISASIAMINGQSPPTEEPSDASPGMPDHRWVIVVSVVEPEGQFVAFEQAFDLVVDALVSLRNATGAAIPDPSIERVQPMYMMGLQHDGGEVVPWNIVVVEHVVPGPPRPATDDELAEAEAMLVRRLRRDPVEQYRTFSTKARIALWQEGNYANAVLDAAIACEVLIKATSAMIVYETSRLVNGPGPLATTRSIMGLRPSQLIGQVLQPRLGGNWDSRTDGRPVREWRVAVARTRSALVHLGVRPDRTAAEDAVRAMDLLAEHVMDRLADSAASYPRTAYALVGPRGLERRGRLESALGALAGATDTPADWIVDYARFVEGLVAGDE